MLSYDLCLCSVLLLLCSTCFTEWSSCHQVLDFSPEKVAAFVAMIGVMSVVAQVLDSNLTIAHVYAN